MKLILSNPKSQAQNRPAARPKQTQNSKFLIVTFCGHRGAVMLSEFHPQPPPAGDNFPLNEGVRAAVARGGKEEIQLF